MYNYNAKLVRVIDGDSIIVDIDLGFNMWIKNVSVRLHEVDAPEIRTKDDVEKTAGYLAKSRVETLLSDGKLTLTTILDKNDKFNRTLAVVWNSEGDVVNTILLEERLGIHFTGQSPEERKRLHDENFAYLIQEGKMLV
jgi:endonuclease YncB( thermonuclease family)